MIRICSALGTWQIIIMIAALHQAEETNTKKHNYQHILLLYGQRLSASMKQDMENIANLLWDWSDIFWIDDILDIDDIKKAGSLDPIKETLFNRIGLSQVQEIWLGKISEPPEKMLVEAFVTAKIILYEDGLHTYVPKPPFHWSLVSFRNYPILAIEIIKAWLFNDISALKRAQGFRYSFNHIRRIQNVYLYLARDIPVPFPLNSTTRLRLIENNILKTRIQDCWRLVDRNALKFDASLSKNVVLIPGQCLARWKAMKWDEELTIYSAVIHNLLNKGYSVLWKEHPRNDKPFFPCLKSTNPSRHFGEINISSSFPLEIVLGDTSISYIVGAISTSLFYAQYLFNIQTYTFAQDFSLYLHGDFRYMAKLIIDRVPSVELLK